MILLNFKGKKIKGASIIDEHKEWINVESLRMGLGRAVTMSGGGTVRKPSNPSFSEFSLNRSTDLSSADLFMEAAGGMSLGTAELHFLQTVGSEEKPQVYLTIELDEAIISSYSINSSGECPSETISINFTKISYKFDAFDGKTVSTGTPKIWDLKLNKKA
ncbi:type VI secretion system tube protein Hcp [Pseudomonas sp. NPDC089554]|uniref:type VI secretion system tube protein Hcp n=1 Tax=Pseudomonas sp. NPDC089554 TaxID=3390653 RepID=UPI003CFFD28E